MTPEQSQVVGIIRTLLERAQRRAMCEHCGEVLRGEEAGEREVNGEIVANHVCRIDERTQAIVRRHWDLWTGGDTQRTRAKGYAVR